MKKPWFALLGLVCLPMAASASVGVSVQIGQPGLYGRIDLGGFRGPPVVYAPPPVVYAPRPPRVIYAPPPAVVYAPPPRWAYARPPRVVYAPPPVMWVPRPPVVVAPYPYWGPPGGGYHRGGGHGHGQPYGAPRY